MFYNLCGMDMNAQRTFRFILVITVLLCALTDNEGHCAGILAKRKTVLVTTVRGVLCLMTRQ